MKRTKLNIILALSFGFFTVGQAFSSDTCNNCQSLNDNSTKAMKQIYAYPEAVYGQNNMIGETNNHVTLSDGSNYLKDTKGVPLAEVTSTQITGAAANLPTWATYDFYKMKTNSSISEPKIDIMTESTRQILKRDFKPINNSSLTGAAAPIKGYFPDVHDTFWASTQINKLARENIAQGYPSGLFKPDDDISRAEMASLLIRGMNLEDAIYSSKATHFNDVPKSYWGYRIISAATENDLMKGCKDNDFKPEASVSKIDAMSMLSKKIDTNMTQEQADKILSNYKNSDKIPANLKLDVAKVIEAKALQNFKNPENVFVNNNATRAEVASMLDNIRISLGYSEKDVPIASNDVTSYIPTEEVVTVPTLKLVFNDIVSARSASVGDIFSAKTLERVTIDGIVFETGSIVRGKVSEVVRPSKGDNGAIKLSFETIENTGHKVDLPTQILTAQVNKFSQPSIGVRLVEMPFTLAGGIIGTAGRTIGGAAISLSNAAEQTLNGIGVASGEMTTGQFRASGRSFQDVGKALAMSPVDLTRTTISGTIGIVKTMGEEVAYVVDADGHKISTIKPKEEVTISFGCYK